MSEKEVVRIKHKKGLGCPGRYGPKNAARMPLFRGEERRFASKPPKDNQSACVTKNRLVFRQTSKETVEALARKGPRQGKYVVGFPYVSQQA